MNHAATSVAMRIRDHARVVDASSVVAAYLVAKLLRWRQGATWVPAGGASPRAVLGHVNAALELAEQLRAAAMAPPTRIYVPLGTGGTAAGLLLGLRFAELRIPVTVVRVVPRVLGTARRIASLANRTARFIEQCTDESAPRVATSDIAIAHDFYGGAYGRPVREHARIHAWATSVGLSLDDTYSLKACAAALASREPRPLLWLTFDGRVLRHGWPTPSTPRGTS